MLTTSPHSHGAKCGTHTEGDWAPSTSTGPMLEARALRRPGGETGHAPQIEEGGERNPTPSIQWGGGGIGLSREATSSSHPLDQTPMGEESVAHLTRRSQHRAAVVPLHFAEADAAAWATPDRMVPTCPHRLSHLV